MKIRSIRSKVLIAIIGITLATALAIAGFFYWKSAQMIEDNYITVLQQRIRNTMDNIDDGFKNVSNIAINASCDSQIKNNLQAYIADGDEQHLTDLAARLRIFKKESSLITSMYLVIPEKRQVVTTLDYPVYKSGVSRKKIRKFEKKIRQNSDPEIMNDIVHDEKKLLLFSENVTGEDGTLLGYVCANIEEQELSYGYFKSPAAGELAGVSLLKNGIIAASGELSTMGNPFDKDGNYSRFMNGSDVSGTDNRNIYIYCEGSFSGCGIFAKVERNAVLSDLQKMRKYIGGIVLLFVVAALLAAIYIAHLVYRPVKKLTFAMKQIAGGQLDARAEVVSKDEIGMAAEEFNRMLDQVEELMHQLIAEEKEKKDAELEALQYQITPHFMYNTLNSIKYYALIRKENEIAAVIEDFVELLQTCIRKKGTFLTVAEEVQVLENYIHLQEFRSGEAYDVQFDIGDAAQQCLVPRLILQPLVENAILHGMDIKKKQGKLTITACVKEGVLYLAVKDNGRGMSEKTISELLHGKEKKTKGLTAVGIPNIVDRLKLYYGNEAGLSFESTEEGTTARIYMPANKNGEGEKRT